MAPPSKIPADDSDNDPALAANFQARMGGRAVNVLRTEMAAAGFTIGSQAIQAAKAGSRGLRLETLQKFADFFGCTVLDLLDGRTGARAAWPFKAISPDDYSRIDADLRVKAENFLLAGLLLGGVPDAAKDHESDRKAA